MFQCIYSKYFKTEEFHLQTFLETSEKLEHENSKRQKMKTNINSENIKEKGNETCQIPKNMRAKMVRKKANNLFEIGLFRVLWKFDLGAHQGGNLTGDRRKKERKTKEREMGGWESVLSGGAAFLSPPVDGAWNYVSCLFLFFCVFLSSQNVQPPPKRRRESSTTPQKRGEGSSTQEGQPAPHQRQTR